MSFRSTFWKTILDLTGWKSMLLLILLPTATSFVYIFLKWNPDEYWPEQVITHYALNRLLMVSFFWVSGFFLAFLVISKAAASIAKEAQEGTLLILVSKPVNRRNIVLAKLSALLLWTVILVAIILLLLVLTMWLSLGLTDDTLMVLLKAVLWLLVPSAVVALFFGTLTMAMSSITKNVIPIVVVMACLTMFVFLLGPVLRDQMISNDNTYTDYHLYIWDISYHISNAAVPFQEQASGNPILPEQLVWWSSNYVLPPTGDLSGFSEVHFLHPAFPLEHVRPLTSLLVLAVISLAALRLSLFAIQRKDVH